MARYDHEQVERHWQERWAREGTFRAAEDSDKPKFYALCMFPYPSGSGLHVGHPLSYTAIDIVARYKRMRGFSVLNPIGFDSFGLPTERAAQREDRHPAIITRDNRAYFRTQLQRLGFAFDWEREVSTHEPEFYRWTQWIFLKLHERGLAYLAEVPVNWCPAQGTVLANEEVVDGRYVETGDLVERRKMKQWMLKITEYAQRLLDDLDTVDWPEGIKEMQRQWIGRSEGAEVTFPIAGAAADSFVVYTTRPDTLFGATYCVLAPEHPLVERITTDAQRDAVTTYVSAARNKSDLDRQVAADKEKTGVFTGAMAINPVNGEQVPVWVADYVLATYGTGAIMAVPAHDERDHAFARAFDLPIRPVYQPEHDHDFAEGAWAGAGTAVGSGEFDGMTVDAFKPAIIAWLEGRGAGVGKVNYKLRDWLFSRQRYWGEPFPIVHLEDGSVRAVAALDLPVVLPQIDAYKPTVDGQPPLARAEEWLRTEIDGQPALRETNTMPQWAGSCWYYLRYMDPHNTALPFGPDKVEYWNAVDLYIGGVEHAVLHLLYARFWHKVLFDCGLVPTEEPFSKLYNQGMLLAYAYREASGKYHHPDSVEHRPGEAATVVSAWSHQPVQTEHYVTGTDTAVEQKLGKMGKSLNNSVDPLDIVGSYGADTLRMYLMFMGPLDQVKPWQTAGCDGIRRFLDRTWRLFVDAEDAVRPFGATSSDVRRALHVAIREATEGIDALKFNTPISKMMELVNATKGALPAQADCEAFLRILSPYAPHLAEELWSRIGHTELIAHAPWPEFDPAALQADTVTLVVQVNGKLRAKIDVAADASKEEVLALARAEGNVVKYLTGHTLVREIVVPGRLVNLVVRPE